MAKGVAGGDLFTIRSEVSSDDSSNPTYATTAVKLGCNYIYGYLYITLGGTTPSWDVTPLYNNPDGDGWADGSTFYGVSGATVMRYKVNLKDVFSFQCRCDSSSGSSPTIAIQLEAFDDK